MAKEGGVDIVSFLRVKDMFKNNIFKRRERKTCQKEESILP
jgi:hypothetical protein